MGNKSGLTSIRICKMKADCKERRRSRNIKRRVRFKDVMRKTQLAFSNMLNGHEHLLKTNNLYKKYCAELASEEVQNIWKDPTLSKLEKARNIYLLRFKEWYVDQYNQLVGDNNYTKADDNLFENKLNSTWRQCFYSVNKDTVNECDPRTFGDIGCSVSITPENINDKEYQQALKDFVCTNKLPYVKNNRWDRNPLRSLSMVGRTSGRPRHFLND